MKVKLSGAVVRSDSKLSDGRTISYYDSKEIDRTAVDTRDDQAQPGILKVASGEMVTAFELITQGLAFFITLVTLWSAKPLKMTNELKFLLGGLLGFALALCNSFQCVSICFLHNKSHTFLRFITNYLPC